MVYHDFTGRVEYWASIGLGGIEIGTITTALNASNNASIGLGGIEIAIPDFE